MNLEWASQTISGRERVCQSTGAEHGDELLGYVAHIGGDRGQKRRMKVEFVLRDCVHFVGNTG